MGNVLFNRYLKNTNYITNSHHQEDLKRFQQALQYFRKYGSQYELDSLMLAAVGYQESRLIQSTKSQAGAVGIMQLLPSTAKDKNINIPDIQNIESNIHAGTKYLRFIKDRYFSDDDISELDKILFSFASYNAGPAKVAKLRKEAQKMGLDPNVWFKNVELVAAKRIGRETVQYVSNIYKYFIGYQLLSHKIEKETTQ